MSEPGLSARERLIVALDLADPRSALALAERVAPEVGVFKVGLELFCRAGPELVDRIVGAFPGHGVFLDLKLLDIANTMARAVEAVAERSVRWLTVHTSAGLDHLQACQRAAGTRLGLLGVTVLTSHSAATCAEVGCVEDPGALVERRAALAAVAGLAGVVCSGLDLARVVPRTPGLARIVPGIRPAGARTDDQVRVATPAQAIAEGATHLVVGRPITQAGDPRAAAAAIGAEIAAAVAARPSAEG